MRTRVAVLVLVALTVMACIGPFGGTTTSSPGTTTTTTIATTTSEGASSSTTLAVPGAVDADWACYYVPNVLAIPIPDGAIRADFVNGILALLNSSGIPASEIFADDESLLGGGDPPTDMTVGDISAQIEPVVALISISEDDPAQVSAYLNQQDSSIGASPIHAVAPATHWVFKPGTDPVPIDNLVLDPVDDADVTAPYVAVIDTGLVHEAASWAEFPNVLYEEYDIEPDPGAASHGTFITGLIRQISPLNPVSMARVPLRDLNSFATTNEDQPTGVALSDELFVFEAVIRMINRHVNNTDVVALNMSLGTYTCDPEGDDLLVVLAAALRMWDAAFPGSTTFAAGGNEEHNQPFWPGALDNVRAVAAAGLNGQQVVWDAQQHESDYPGRPWINDVAPGSNLVSLAGAGNTQFVSWSGSSFATAVASALFARGEDPFVEDKLNWWLDSPVNFENVSGLTYTETPDPLAPVIHVESPGVAGTVPTTP